MTYRDRREAGIRLAAALAEVPATTNLVSPAVLGVVRGGVPVAAEVADGLGGTLGPAFATKIGAPGNPEYAIGALADSTPLVDELAVLRLGISASQLEAEIAKRIALLDEKRARFAAYEITLAGRDVVVVDDGVATGNTVEAVLESVRRQGANQVWLAVPVGPPDTIRRLGQRADVVICPMQPVRFMAVGAWYERFPQLSDEDVEATLRRGIAV